MEKDSEFQMPLLSKVSSNQFYSFDSDKVAISQNHQSKETELNEIFHKENNSNYHYSDSDHEDFDLESIIIAKGEKTNCNRLQIIQNFKFSQMIQPKNILVEINLTLILLREMKENPKVLSIILISNLLDISIRINCYVILFLIIFNDIQSMKIIAILLLVSPRIIQFLAQLKLLVINLHKKSNQSLLQLSILFRQNFSGTEWSNYVNQEWYSWRKNEFYVNTSKMRIILFLFLPTEICILQFRSRNGLLTFLISGFILKTIEIIIFTPWLLVLLYLNQYVLNNRSYIGEEYRIFSIFLLYLDIAKYIFLSIFYLTKRNYQINKFQIFEEN